MVKPGLLATKLHRPPAPPGAVARPHLTARLTEGLAARRRITLVSAPAGFGKTTCVVEWLNELKELPAVWLSLDPADNDPARFAAYLVTALQSVEASLCRELEAILRAGHLPAPHVVSTALVNEIVSLGQTFVLVLDDVHVIQNSSVVELLEHLISNLPQSMHLVLVTREDPPLPLARLRANNELTEIRASHLRFSHRDAQRFLNERMQLSLSSSDVALLDDKTEGWIAGLQLAALAVQSRRATLDADRPSEFIAALGGSHRFILGYLVEEVLSKQPDEIQRFLLQTSILDQLSGDLCDAVTGASNGRVLLQRLLRANLFLIPLDDGGEWYRYHHLFADLLRDRQAALGEESLAELHRRASRWYAAADLDGSVFAREAVGHALAARDYVRAVELLEQHATGMIMEGYAGTVHSWVKAIPDELQLSSPGTHLAFAWMHLLRGSYDDASPHLARAREAFGDLQEAGQPVGERASLYAEWLVMQALRLSMEGEVAQSEAAAARALDIAPQRDSRVRSLAWFARGGAWQAREAYSRAEDAYQASLQHARAAGNAIAEWLSTSGLGLMAFERGKLHLAFDIASAAIARGERAVSLPPISAVVYGLIGEVCYQWLEIERARQAAERALELSTLGGYNTGALMCRVILSRLAQLEGDVQRAVRWIEEARSLMPVEVADYVKLEVVAQEARARLASGRPALARLALTRLGFSFDAPFSYPAFAPAAGVTYSAGLLYNSSLHLLLDGYATQDGDEGLTTGIELAGHLIDRASASECKLVTIEAHLLRARMQAALGNTQAAEADYVRSVVLAEPEGVLGLFVEQGAAAAQTLGELAKQKQLDVVDPAYVERIVAACSEPPADRATGGGSRGIGQVGAPSMEPLIDPLTGRELDVLRLMADGLTYKEVAGRLFVSVNTVRFHVKAVYGKLGVNNRTQAIARARDLRVL